MYDKLFPKCYRALIKAVETLIFDQGVPRKRVETVETGIIDQAT